MPVPCCQLLCCTSYHGIVNVTLLQNPSEVSRAHCRPQAIIFVTSFTLCSFCRILVVACTVIADPWRAVPTRANVRLHRAQCHVRRDPRASACAPHRGESNLHHQVSPRCQCSVCVGGLTKPVNDHPGLLPLDVVHT